MTGLDIPWEGAAGSIDVTTDGKERRLLPPHPAALITALITLRAEVTRL